MRRVMRVAADKPVVLGTLANDLKLAIANCSTALGAALEDHWSGAAGAGAAATTRSLFDMWCRQSLVASPGQAAALVAAELAGRAKDVAAVAAVLKSQCEVPAADADRAAPELIGAWAASGKAESLIEPVWNAYSSTRGKFCAQTAHVLLARVLLYRVGEDKGLFAERLSGESWEREKANAVASPWLPNWLFALLEQVRTDMRELVPSVYERGEFDWWVVDGTHRRGLGAAERAVLELHDGSLSAVLQDGVDALDKYTFKAVDVDVWHDVYQHYLPAEERQKLGGFYTPDDLVALTLECAGWVPLKEGLCTERLIDPACGSGTFLVQATQTLLRHLDQPFGCHSAVTDAKTSWERSQREIEHVAAAIHGIDLHPFAAFLATLNVLFVVLEGYVQVKTANPGFVLDLSVFAHDSLEKTKAEEIAPGLWEAMNSRVALSEHSFKRFAEIVDRKFDVVAGNPPWGGILKGRLAPVFDLATKERYRREYTHSAKGKYDIYGLFIERGLGWLSETGRLSLITQNTYFDKDWAADLRALLSTSCRMATVVDLGPFGQLFFEAMNTPAITAVANEGPEPASQVAVVRTHPPAKWASRNREGRRSAVVRSVREALRTEAPRRASTAGIAYFTPVPQAQLAATSATRWQFDSAIAVKGPRHPVAVSSVLQHRQGVTPAGALDLFLMGATDAAKAGLETVLARKAFKSRKLQAWSMPSQDLVLLFPYLVAGDRLEPAFSIKHPKLKDALDLDISVDRWEATRRGTGGSWAAEIVERRIAEGLIAYPNAARYLVRHYDRLQSRTFKQQNIREFGRQWYEYLWPRGVEVAGQGPRIVSPTLVKSELRFALDREGLLSDHATIFLVQTKVTAGAFGALRKRLADVRGVAEADEDVLLYLLAHMNTDYAMDVMRRGRNPTAKGYYTVNEGFLDELFVDGSPTRAAADDAIGFGRAQLAALGKP